MSHLQYCLNIEFIQNKDNIIPQKKYIDDILYKFKMQDSKVITTLLNNNVKLTKDACPETEQGKSEMINIPYHQLTGSLMYLSVATRPGIRNTVNFLSQFNNNFKNFKISQKYQITRTMFL